MTNEKVVKLLKVVMLIGIGFILFGHYLMLFEQLHESQGVKGIITIAACIALGLILSLPTKIYLTLVFMKNESEKQAKP